MKVILAVFVLGISSLSYAELLKDKVAAKNLAKSVMEQVASGNIEEGIKLTKPYLIIPAHEFEGMLTSMRMQAPAIEQRFGKTIGAELIKTEESAESLLRVIYIQKFETHMIRWNFFFYKPKDGWVLNTFRTDDKIQLMFDSH